MRKTKSDLMGVALSGHQPRYRPTVPLEIGMEYGWLTALKQSAGDKRFMVMRCRCGEQVIRRSSVVRSALAAGIVPSCPKCMVTLKREAKERRAG